MTIGYNGWDAIGSCATALISLGLLIIGVLGWRMQKKRFRGKLQFELTNNGDYISASLTNTGECVAREIRLSSKPPLAIKFNNRLHFDGCVGSFETWLLDSTIHELLPHRSIIDPNPYPTKDFNIHFSDYSTIVICLQYTMEGEVINDYQTIDVELLRMQQMTKSSRERLYKGLKEISQG